MTNKVSGNQGVTGDSDVEAAATTASSNTLLNQEINISNYMDYAQTTSYASTTLQANIDLTPLVVNGQVVQTYDVKNGVSAEAFVSTGTGPQHIVIGYAGTGVDVNYSSKTGLDVTTSLYSDPHSKTGSSGDLFTGAQVYNDVAILAGKTPIGAKPAAAFAQEVISDAAQLGIHKNKIYMTGHNLGGTLAEYAAAKTGLAGTTFGAAGINDAGSTTASNFTNIVTNGDPIGNYATNGSDPLGPIVLSPDINHYGNEKLVGEEANQMKLRADAANAYASHDYAKVGSGLGADLTNNLLEVYAGNLNNVNLISLGSHAVPPTKSSSTAGASSHASAPAVASGHASAAPATSLPASSVPMPSSQVVNQDINICNYMYSSRTVAFSSTGVGQLNLTPLLQKNGNIVQVYNQKAGVSGEAFETTGTSSPQIIIAYEGTNPYGLGNTNAFSGSQLLDDAAFFAGKPAPCAAAAGNFAKRVINIAAQDGISADNVSLTGHSLGAAEAEYAAEATGLTGVTFGTPGIDITGNLPPSQLTNFVNMGDPVGNLGTDGEDPLGNFVTSKKIAHYGGVTLVGSTATGSTKAQANLAATSKHFFNPNNPAYKNFYVALKRLGKDFKYHHLSEYAASLDASGYTGIALVCYCTGTAIRASSGDRAVETLCPGDLVVTASGETRPIKWIGHRTIDCHRHSQASEVWPIRIAAHALGENRPARDLFVSPGHAICIDAAGEVLVPASALVNGRTIVREPVDQVTYWHVELESHDILLAENLPAESYLDMGNRGFFKNAEVVDLAAGPDAAVPSHADFCRPFVDRGPVLEVIRARLDAKANAPAGSRAARAA